MSARFASREGQDPDAKPGAGEDVCPSCAGSGVIRRGMGAG
jgi:hypothetical protein